MINELPIDLNNKQADALNPFDFIKRMRPSAPVGNITRVRASIQPHIHNKSRWILLLSNLKILNLYNIECIVSLFEPKIALLRDRTIIFCRIYECVLWD